VGGIEFCRVRLAGKKAIIIGESNGVQGPAIEKCYSAVGVDDPSTVKKNVIRGLLKLGYNEADIAKIMAENMLRVYR